MTKFNNKYAAVTGAAQGIGRAIAKRLLDDGVEAVALLDLNGDAVAQTAAELDPTAKRALAVQCDVASADSVDTAFGRIFDAFGRVDILVNNAGITRDAMFHNMTIAQFKQVIDVHLYGTFHCCQKVVLGMRERGYGKIVNISSTSAFGNPGQANYAAAKAGIDGLTRTLAKELGRHNITVNSIAPGMTDTDIIKTVPQNVLDGFIARCPMQRLGKPEEIAAVAAFLASDDSSFVSGMSILCCGGSQTQG